MNNNRLPILEFRDQKIELEETEIKLGIKLPPIYKAFLSNFKPEPQKQFVYLKRTEKEKKFIGTDYRLITSVAYSSSNKSNITDEDDELGFITFKNINSLLEFCIPEEEGMNDMIYISDHGSSDALLVGTGSENCDKIFIESELNQKQPVELFAKNVFDFLFDCQIVESHFDRINYDHIRKIDCDRVYKNWGENFWRIKSE